jgi:chemotaxis protein CheD
LGGINHYLLPLWNGEGLPTPKYGNIAISKLLEKVRAHSRPGDKLIAKVFGGASMWEKTDGLLAVGQRNVSAKTSVAIRAAKLSLTVVTAQYL